MQTQLTETFKTNYLKSLTEDYKFYYDNLAVYGQQKPDNPTFYFIPGINGVPGQIRFALPALHRQFGHEIFIQCLNLPEFSAQTPIWEKYTLANITKKASAIAHDLNSMSFCRDQLMVVASSNGFYDFLHAYGQLTDETREKIRLFWVASAPDSFQPTRWHDFFYRLNGFEHNDHQWVAFPNHNLLKRLNPETSTSFNWTHQKPHKKLMKHDLESRFRCFGVYWGYASISCFNEMLQYCISQLEQPITIPTFILTAQNDGYWQGASQQAITQNLTQYVENPDILFEDRSHLWVVTPENLTKLLRLASSKNMT
ncbi:MAG: hypothetical protein V3U75_00580 [Methylococcaceae bacterium]